MSDNETSGQETGNNGKPKARPPPEQTKVTMTDGREVVFVGKRNIDKTGKVEDDGAISAQFDFRNGETTGIRLEAGDPLILKLAVHGLLQKGGDEAAGVKDEHGQPDVDSMALAVDSILKRLANVEADLDTRWSVERAAGDGFSGAATVVKALVEVLGKDVAWVKAFLEKKLTAGKEAGLTRQKLYQAFRAPGTKTAPVIERLEREKLAGKPAINADEFLAEMAEAE